MSKTLKEEEMIPADALEKERLQQQLITLTFGFGFRY
jgi:hypothetical protein